MSPLQHVRRLLGKAESLVWFLKRPALYPQMLHLARQRIFASAEPDTRAASTAWCEERAVEIEEAIQRLTGEPMGEPVMQLYPAVFSEAHAKAAACPVKMGGPAALDLLYWVALRVGAKRAIETGVAYGWSSLALLLAMQGRAGARLISTDMPYVRANNDAYVGLVVPERFKTQWKLIRLADRQGLPQALQELGSIDVCHYDSDKSYSGRLWAYPRLWRALRPGAVFFSDDVNDNWGFRDFAASVGVEPVVIRVQEPGAVKFAGALVKPA